MIATISKDRGLLWDLLIVREIVDQIGERFGVHQPVFDRDVNQLLGRLTKRIIDNSPDLAVVRSNFFDGRPIGRLILGSFPDRRINPEFEQLVESRMEGWNVDGLSADQIPIKGLEVAQVED